MDIVNGASPSEGKICYFCGGDCAGQSRGKDPQGRYYHTACFQRARSDSSGPAGFGSASPNPHAAAARDESHSILGGLLDDISPTTQCLGCGAPLQGGAVICTSCGYDTRSGGQLQSQFIPAAPPVAARGALAQRGNAAWPTVIGIISICWAVGGILFHIVDKGLLVLAASGQGGSYAAGVSIGALLGLAIPVALGLWLLFAGINLLRRRRAAEKSMKSWATTRILLAVVCGGIQIASLAAGGESTKRMGMAENAQEVQFMLIGTVIVTIVALTYPIFILIWFSRKAVKDEIESWQLR